MTEHRLDFRDTEVDPQGLRRALGRFATGVTVVTTRDADGNFQGLTVNSFSAVSLAPPLVLWSISHHAPSRPSFVRAGRFAINVLGAHQRDLSQHFARPAADKFSGIDHEPGLGGCPLLPGCVASFECRTETTYDGGDHTIIIGRIERTSHRDGNPLIFSAGRYCTPARLDEAV